MYKFMKVVGIIIIFLTTIVSFGQGTLTSNPIINIPSTINTADKPQSKIWKHNGFWWAVFPNIEGTHIWRLDNKNNWTKNLTISTNSNTKADCKKNGDKTYILLFDGVHSELINTKFNSNKNTYEFLNANIPSTKFSFNSSTETVTIDIDGNNIMWLAYEEDTTIKVNSSNFPYTTWGVPTIIATDVKPDDICSIIALPNKTAILWSNQNTKFFGFRTHINGDLQNNWSTDEQPAFQSQLSIGGGLSDDHINMAVTSDGTLYCAVKTSFDTLGYPLISLLKRNNDGKWDDLYFIDDKGTRPIVVINEYLNMLQVIYTDIVSSRNIVYKESKLSTISFGEKYILIKGGNYNNASSTKDNYSDNLVIIASTQTSPFTIVGVYINTKK